MLSSRWFNLRLSNKTDRQSTYIDCVLYLKSAFMILDLCRLSVLRGQVMLRMWRRSPHSQVAWYNNTYWSVKLNQ